MERFYKTFVEHFKKQPTSVLEIGSRDGIDAEALRVLGDIKPEDVNIVEPHPESFRSIIKSFPDFRVFELAVSTVAGVLNFNAIPPSTYPQSVVGTSSLLPRDLTTVAKYNLAPPPERWVKVLSVTGNAILQLINKPEIDLVKIDVEGLTYEVIQSFGDDIRLLKALHLEVEVAPLQIWQGQHSHKDVWDYMSYYGFTESYYDGKYWNAHQGDSIWVRND